MPDLDREEIAAIVRRVVAKLKESPDSRSPRKEHSSHGIFPDVNSAVDAAREGHRKLIALSLEKRKEIIANIRKRCRENVKLLSEMAVSETGLGRVSDKIAKNLLVIDKTPGVEILMPIAYTGDFGMTLVERAPYGVIGSITPVTNPSETIICNAIGMIAGGNAVVFNAHPNAKGVASKTVNIIWDAILEAGGPENAITSMENPTIETAQEVMKHPGVRLLVVTGGPGVVRAAMNSGKRAIAAGPGNPPVVVDETADIEKAGKDIVNGASLDNNIVCVVEKEVFAVASIAERLKEAMKRSGAYELPSRYLGQIERIVLKDGKPEKKWIGKDASLIAREMDIRVPEETRILLVETDFHHPLVQEEMLMPVLPFVRVKDVEEGMALALKAEHGFFHTSVMHSRNIANLSMMAKLVNTSIFVKNAPSYAGLGLGGEGYTSFTIASPTGEGLTTALHFTRERRCTLAEYFRIV